jgi:acid phosphatase
VKSECYHLDEKLMYTATLLGWNCELVILPSTTTALLSVSGRTTMNVPSTRQGLSSSITHRYTTHDFRLFARGFLGPNSTLGDLYAITASDPSAVGNSLATSDSCPTFDDISGGDYVATWDSIYLPPIAERLNTYIEGDLVLNEADVSIFPYLCGFESQITRRLSPFCAVLTRDEILQYEYRQDLRYWYGTGPGTFNNASVMLPVLQGIIDLFVAGPETSVIISPNETDTLGPLTVAFTHDNQINELASILGVFDDQPPLAADSMNETRVIFLSGGVNFQLTAISSDLCVQSYQSHAWNSCIRATELLR